MADSITVTKLREPVYLWSQFKTSVFVYEWQGTTGPDSIAGHGQYRNRIFGLDGDDALFGGKGGGSDSLSGGAGDDTLRGGLASDRLDGGPGADVMRGGEGADTYFVDNPGDVVIEKATSGSSSDYDTIYSSIDYTLSGQRNLEVLYLTGDAITGSGSNEARLVGGNDRDNILSAGTTAAIAGKFGPSLYGGAGDDTLRGGLGSDRLNGGTGADLMMGGRGHDIYSVDDPGDVIVERMSWGPPEGENAIHASIDFSLAGLAIRDLSVSGEGIRGTGNDLRNHIRGDNSGNILDGGRGVDTLEGGYGHDLYYLRTPGDTIIERSYPGGKLVGGVDTALAFGSFKMAHGLDHMILQDMIGKTGAPVQGLTAIGNGLNNRITGNAFDNNLNGWGGQDTLTGGAGADDFIFSTALQANNTDRITDFTPGVDRIVIKAALLGLPAGTAGDAFHAGPQAVAAEDRLVFDGATLWYDPDGNGADAALVITTFDGTPALTAADILLV